MAKNEVALFDDKAQLPAHLQEAFADQEDNVITRESVPALTFRGAKWRIKIGDEEKLIQRRSQDGDLEPVPIVKVVVVGVNPERSRNFYEGDFVEGENKQPDCWSIDGKVPSAMCSNPIASTCAACPNSVKGSAISKVSGAEVTACTQYKRLAVVPINKMDMPALLLKLPQTTIWDKENPYEEQGWFAWDQFMKFLKNRGVKHTASLVIKMKFDPDTAYPKLLFAADRWINESEVARIRELCESEEVTRLIHGDPEESARDEKKLPDTTAETEEVVEDEDEVVEEKPVRKTRTTKAAEPEKKAPAKRTRKAATKKEEPEDDDFELDDDEPEEVEEKSAKKQAVTDKKKASTKKAAKPEPEVEESENGAEDLYDGILDDWDDEGE